MDTNHTTTAPAINPIRAKQVGIEGRTFQFVAATEGKKRDGLNLQMRGARVDSYLENPVVLWAHDYRGTNLPIGRVTRLQVMKARIKVWIEFDQADPFAVEIERKYRDGYLHAVSIGWDIRQWDPETREVTEWDLLDVSAVPVPGDPLALIERARAFLADDLDGHRGFDALEVSDTDEFEVLGDWETTAVRSASAGPTTEAAPDEEVAPEPGPSLEDRVAALEAAVHKTVEEPADEVGFDVTALADALALPDEE